MLSWYGAAASVLPLSHFVVVVAVVDVVVVCCCRRSLLLSFVVCCCCCCCSAVVTVVVCCGLFAILLSSQLSCFPRSLGHWVLLWHVRK